MKIPKRLQELYESKKKQIHERNVEFHDSFIEENYSTAQTKRRIDIRLITVLSCVIALLTATTVFVALWKPVDDVTETPKYYAELEKVSDSSLTDFLSDVSTLTFDFGAYDITTVSCVYDETTTDDLYYHLIMENVDSLEFVDLKVSVNRYYRFQELWATPTEYNTQSVKTKYLIDAGGETIYATLTIGDVEAYLIYTVYDSDAVEMYKAFIGKAFAYR